MAIDVRVYSFADRDGGAAIAAYRLTEGLQAIFPELKMTVFEKGTDDPTVEKAQSRISQLVSRFAFGIDAIPLRRYRHRENNIVWSTNWFPYGGLFKHIQADILHFHWIGRGMIPIAQIGRLKAPIVWTMHDEWPFTGGCHYTNGCQRFETACGSCPQLRSHGDRDLSRSIWSRKEKAWRTARIIPVAPSRWLAERATTSSLFRKRDIRVIPNGLDLNTFRPIEKPLARRLLQLPQDKLLILFGASRSTSDPRKGFPLLLDALGKLTTRSLRRNDLELLVFGASHSPSTDALAIPTHYVGTLHDDLMLALLYSAADVFVAPSQQDNLPNTIMESLACGTPAVGFRVGGIPDLIEHEANGYLAAPADADDLARGIAWVIEDQERWQRLSARARQKCQQEFELSYIARRYADLYEEVSAQA